jgi:hypothetical protein
MKIALSPGDGHSCIGKNKDIYYINPEKQFEMLGLY